MGLDPNLYKQIVKQKMVLWLQYNLSYRTTLVHIDMVHRRLTSALKTGGPTISGNLCLVSLIFSRDWFFNGTLETGNAIWVCMACFYQVSARSIRLSSFWVEHTIYDAAATTLFLAYFVCFSFYLISQV